MGHRSYFGNTQPYLGEKHAQASFDGLTFTLKEREEREVTMALEYAKRALDAEGRIISLKEASRLIGASYQTTMRLAQSGELKAFRIRKTWRTSEAACEEFVRHQFRLQALACRSVEVEP